MTISNAFEEDSRVSGVIVLGDQTFVDELIRNEKVDVMSVKFVQTFDPNATLISYLSRKDIRMKFPYSSSESRNIEYKRFEGENDLTLPSIFTESLKRLIEVEKENLITLGNWEFCLERFT